VKVYKTRITDLDDLKHNRRFVVLVWFLITLTTFHAKIKHYKYIFVLVKVMPEILLVPFFRTPCILNGAQSATCFVVTVMDRCLKCTNMHCVLITLAI